MTWVCRGKLTAGGLDLSSLQFLLVQDSRTDHSLHHCPLPQPGPSSLRCGLFGPGGYPELAALLLKHPQLHGDLNHCEIPNLCKEGKKKKMQS